MSKVRVPCPLVLCGLTGTLCGSAGFSLFSIALMYRLVGMGLSPPIDLWLLFRLNETGSRCRQPTKAAKAQNATRTVAQTASRTSDHRPS